MDFAGAAAPIFTNLVDFTVLGILILELISGIRKAPFKTIYLRRNAGSIMFSLIFIGLFCYSKYLTFHGWFTGTEESNFAVVAVRNFFLILKVFSRYRRINTILENLHIHPALTITLSFLMVILAGTWLLMMPFTAQAGHGLPFINALFTATSAVCVTGLIVVDTAVYFSIWGKIVIMLLIQIGGLGIMVLSYFTLFVLRRKVSVEQKSLVSYMLSEEDMNNLAGILKSIVGITFLIEGMGAFILTLGFRNLPDWPHRIFYGVFHAVSAFCNAGFALFSDSLEGFAGQPLIILTVSMLIIFGGLSFGVFTNLRDAVRGKARISLNTRLVLSSTALLLLLGMAAVYPLEHVRTMKGMSLGKQYLGAFFQSVTLRTAGFNSISFSNLATSTLVIMMVFMFIGGASGSTAGGIKVNTARVLLASIRSAWKGEEKVIIHSMRVAEEKVNRAFLILLLGLATVLTTTFCLSITENLPLRDIMFESVSAFGTVGLSTGITGSLSIFGKTVIVFSMFIGRLGPLTLLTAASTEQKKISINYPQANIAVG
ncbi:MAG: TrkH family potassium uptake protein [Spirochaetales bacterium]|nr:MAG: TrkH family potassium uptake protein [Spirochaetales bacterium]